MADDGIPKIAPQQQSKKGQKSGRGSQPVSQMTIREAMAAQNLAALIQSSGDRSPLGAEQRAETAVDFADALLKELEK